MHEDTLRDDARAWFGTNGFGEQLMPRVRQPCEVRAPHGHEPLRRPFELGVEVLTPRH